MASSSSYPHVTLKVGDDNPYPYPSNLSASSFSSVKLSGRDDYRMWKTQMICLLKSHDMYGFIDGTLENPQTSVSGKEKDHIYRLWTRSDALVKGWMIGSLSKQTLGYVLKRLTEKHHQLTDAADVDFTAKDVWDELKTIYGPPAQLIVSDKQQKDKVRQWAPEELDREELYRAVLGEYWDGGMYNIDVEVTEKITPNGNTALHVAVGRSGKPEFIQELLKWTPENTQLSDVRNSDGSTLLHVAAIVGNTEAAKILVGRDPDLLLARDNEGHTPLVIALSNMHTETAHHLLQHINAEREKDLFSGTSGDEILVTVISSKDFRLAHDLVGRYRTLDTDAVLMAIAQNFPCEANILGEYSLSGATIFDAERVEVDTLKQTVDICDPLCGLSVGIMFYRLCSGVINLLLKRILKMLRILLVWPFIKEKIQIHDNATKLLVTVCRLITHSVDLSFHHHYYKNPILEATRKNAYEVVYEVVTCFPNAIWSANEDGHDIIQYAVICRSENVYNLLYQMSDHKNIYRTMKDSSGNNLLHLVAKLAPTNKLNLISGAALQVQHELQWFKEIERFICPLTIMQKNSFDETPQMVFTREHKNLVIEGEKWMKATAESYTITSTLITTVVFAAAITVPGGNNQNTGIPLFINNTAFKIFAISDAISLFAAITSLLMFLSILTARFAENDFLYKLPTKLIIGLATLFISTTAMIVAFGATLYLVFGQSNSRILIPIAVLTCVPITSFVTLQFPLVIDLMGATYGRSIFGRKREDPFY